MELVYLWVENYKNIHKQGFNFSPRFECIFHDEYDENGKLKDNCKLEIIEKKEDEYIKDFFGENINVTAIVGKNGSGKSSVLEFLKNIVHENNKFCLIFRINNESFLSYNIASLEYDKRVLKEKNIEELESCFFSVLYSSEFNQKNIEESTHQIIANLLKEDKNHIFENFKHIFYPQKMIVTENTIYRKELLNKLKKHLFNRVENKEINFKLNEKVKKLINSNKDNSLIYLMCEQIDDDTGEYENFVESLLDDKIIELGGFTTVQKDFKNYDGSYPDEFEIKSILSDNFMKEIPKKEDWIKKNTLVEEIHQKLCEIIIFSLSSLFKEKFNILDIFFFNEIVKNKLINSYLNEIICRYLNEASVKKISIENCIKSNRLFFGILLKNNNIELGYDSSEFQGYLKNFKLVNLIDMLKDNLFNKYSSFLSFDFIDIRYSNERYFSNLSHGEKTFYSQFVFIFYKIYNNQNKNNLLLFDEPDLSLHPEWQRRYFDELVKITKNLDESIKLHFFVTSHSPFFLSDIPKQNIIFLDKYKEEQKIGNCKVVDGLKEKKQTFGANIHTLLSDSFFMEDGLMGEFAKGKIDEVIAYLNGKKDTDIKTDDEAQKLVNIIGEPIVKNQLQRMLDSKRLKKVDEIDAIKKSMEAMQKRLDELEK